MDYQLRYRAFAASNKRTAEEQHLLDGHMAVINFTQWLDEQWHIWDKENGVERKFYEGHYGDEFTRFDNWLKKKFNLTD